MTASARQRQELILQEVTEKRHVSVKDLAVAIAVSEATVRRDLKDLADAGQLDLVYGGATLPRHSDYSFRSKGQRNTEAKRTIGRLAADLIPDGEQLFLDSGTTCFEVAPFLKRKRGLTVIANSARLALELDTPGVSVIMLGGQYRPERMDTIGPICTGTLDQLRGYVAFIGADGLSPEFGPAAADMESAHLYRLAVKNARESVLLVDHTKFHAPSLFKIVDWDQIARIVTDQLPSPQWMDFLQSRNIAVIHPESVVSTQ